MEALGEAVREDDLTAVAAKLQATLHSLENARLDIGIMGASGSGKSTFVNALRGLGDESQGSAKTGVVDTSSEPIPYQHPKYTNIIIWDLPGIGTPVFQVDEYLEKVLFDRYDFFIIIASEHFMSNHTQLAIALQGQGKHFYFIRSKVDVDLAASRQRRPTTFSEEGVLWEIREYCRTFLQDEGVTKPKVFLISMFNLGKYDFHRLIEAIEKDLVSHKRHGFLMALPNVSQLILQKKKASLLQHVWLVATVICGTNPQPVPGVPGVACDLDLLIHSLECYRNCFCLASPSLCKLSEQNGQPLWAVKDLVGGPMRRVSKTQVIKLLAQATQGVTSTFARELESLPILGVLTNCRFSFATVYHLLRGYLDKSAEDAQKLLLTTSQKDLMN